MAWTSYLLYIENNINECIANSNFIEDKVRQNTWIYEYKHTEHLSFTDVFSASEFQLCKQLPV